MERRLNAEGVSLQAYLHPDTNLNLVLCWLRHVDMVTITASPMLRSYYNSNGCLRDLNLRPGAYHAYLP